MTPNSPRSDIKVAISGDDSTVVSQECLDLVQELYANILRHATAENATYDFAIKATPKGVRIMQSNECSGQDCKGIAPGGSGLLPHGSVGDGNYASDDFCTQTTTCRKHRVDEPCKQAAIALWNARA